MSTLAQNFVASFAVWRKRGASASASGAASSWIITLLLVLQLASAGAPGHRMGAPEASPLPDITSLGALLGHPVSICQHGAPDEPTSPDHDGHCGVCCLLDASVALVPRSGVAICADLSNAAVISSLAPATMAPPGRFVTASSPRGPPTRS